MTKKIEYWLALGGWAARWFIHIWVLQHIEETNIFIREISWTSMWAIIAALYAIWKTSEQITQISKDLNFFKLVDIDLKTGLLKGKKVEQKLEELFWSRRIEKAKIKLKIVATDIVSGKKHVFEKWKIVDALRASLSLPWIFVPKEIKKTLYVDGGITNNLPIDVLRSKNCIWVSALKKVTGELQTTKKFLWLRVSNGFFNMNYQILHRTILLMMKQNEDSSMEKKKDAIIISPNFGDLDYYSFNKIDEFVEVGYKEAKRILKV